MNLFETRKSKQNEEQRLLVLAHNELIAQGKAGISLKPVKANAKGQSSTPLFASPEEQTKMF